MGTLAQDSTFAQEADELLAQIEEAALALEEAADDGERVHLLFRAFHTIKGSSAMVGLSQIASFTHHVETALDRVRAGAVGVTPPLVSAILAAKDHIQHLLTCAIEGRAPDLARGDVLAVQFGELSKTEGNAKADPTGGGPRLRTTFDVYFRLKHDASGVVVDPLDVLAELKSLGTSEVVETAQGDEQFGPAWKVTLTTERDENAIRDVFLFAPSGSELRIEQGLFEFVTEPPPSTAAAMVEAKPAAAEPAPSEGGKRANRSQDVVRVSSARLDQLMKLVGELVITQSRLQQGHAAGSIADLAAPVEAMERLIGELRDHVFSVRLMPVGPTFARFKRLARDLSAQLEKDIELVTHGDETELDKTVLDRLGDPLVHMIRNSLDHGLETPAQRVAQGKPRKGRIVLSAAHDGGHVVITIEDDGRGLDKQAIRAKAEQKGLIAPGAQLSDQDTYELIMRPGFSTAEAVTQLSGRGVGMDVVKRTIESLRGSISITSTRGLGTTMRLRLPLTLAIIDGLVVTIGDDEFIVPMAAVLEAIELPRSERLANNGRNAINVRGEFVPYVRLRELLATRGGEPEIEMIVVVMIEGQRVGLVVDRVVRSHQTVIQPLGPYFHDIELFSGTTIMGDGRAVLIFDIAAVVRHAERAFKTTTYTGDKSAIAAV